MTRRPIRVLHVLGSLNPGGVETWLMSVLRHIDRSQFEFHFCTFGPEPGLLAPEAERLGARVIPCPKRKNLWSLARRFRKILRAGHYDVVHSHVHYFSGAVLRWAAGESVPMRIAHSHTSRDDKAAAPLRTLYRRTTRRWIHKYATHGLAACKDAAASLYGPGWVRDTRYRVLYYGIDLRPFEEPVDRAEIRRELGIPTEIPVVGHVGRFVEAKNHRFLLEIICEVLKLRPDAHFLLIGDGPLRAEIEAQARASGIFGPVHFAGVRDDVPRLMCGAMDAFLFPSLWEGLPVAVIEAQAAGLRTVVSDGVPRELCIDPLRLQFLSLSAGPLAWAERAVKSFSNGLTESQGVRETISKSPFNIARSCSHLHSLYSDGRADET